MSKRRGLLLGAIVGLACLVFYWWAPNTFELFELQLLDYRLRGRPTEIGPEKITVILVDDRAMGRYGLGEKFKVALAELIERLDSQGVKVIGLDIIFTRQGPEPTQATLRLAQAIAGAHCVTLGYNWQFLPLNEPFFNIERAERLAVAFGKRVWRLGYRRELPSAVFPQPEFALISETELVQSACSMGHVSVVSGLDMVARAIPLAVRKEGQFLQPFCVAVVRRYRGEPDWKVEAVDGAINSVTLGGRQISTDMAGRMLLLPPGPPSAFATYDFLSALGGEIPSLRLQDGVVLIGVSAVGGYDTLTTSYGPNTPGVYLHAAAVSNLLDNRSLRRDLQVRRSESVFLLMLPIVLGLLLARIRPLLGLLLPPMIAAALIFVNQLLLERLDTWMVTSYLLIAVFATQIVVLSVRLALTDREMRQRSER